MSSILGMSLGGVSWVLGRSTLNLWGGGDGGKRAQLIGSLCPSFWIPEMGLWKVILDSSTDIAQLF